MVVGKVLGGIEGYLSYFGKIPSGIYFGMDFTYFGTDQLFLGVS